MNGVVEAIVARLKGSSRVIAETLLALLVGFTVGAVLMAVYGYDPVEGYRALFEYSLNPSDPYYLASTLSFATPLMLTALTFAIGVRGGVFNIGAEGALYMGALGVVLVAGAGIGGPLFIPLALAVSLGLGMVWNGIAGLLRAYRGVNEVVSTIMLNWTAFYTVEYVRVYVFPNPHDPSKTVAVPPEARLPLLVEGSELSLGFIIALVATLGAYYLLWHTVVGYEIRATGYNPRAARYGGIKVTRAILYTFLVGGALSGLAGFLELTGRPPHYAVTTGLSNLFGLGFDGITVALIGGNHPIGIVFASILVGALDAGSRGMQIEAGVPMELVRTVQGVIIIALAVPGAIRLIQDYMRRRKLALEGVEASG